jgi:hypothetical protein
MPAGESLRLGSRKQRSRMAEPIGSTRCWPAGDDVAMMPSDDPSAKGQERGCDQSIEWPPLQQAAVRPRLPRLQPSQRQVRVANICNCATQKEC